MAFDVGFNFRIGSSFVTDGDNEIAVTGQTYPTTTNGITYGWDALPPQRSDEDATIDRRLAGGHWIRGTQGNVCTFFVDLPGPGIYKIWIAQGRRTTGTPYGRYRILDSGTERESHFVYLGGTNRYLDADNVIHPSPSDWVNLNGPAEYVFNGSQLGFELRGPNNGNNGALTQLCHIRITQVETVPLIGSEVAAWSASLSQNASDWAGNADGVFYGNATVVEDKSRGGTHAYYCDGTAGTRIASLNSITALATSLWIKLPVIDPDSSALFFDFYRTADTNNGWLFLYGTTTGVRVDGRHDSTVYRDLPSNVFIRDGAWHHLAFIRYSTLWELFVDGVLAASLAVPLGSATSSGTFGIGGLNSSNSSAAADGNYAECYLDDIRMFSSLTAADVAVLAEGRGFPSGTLSRIVAAHHAAHSFGGL